MLNQQDAIFYIDIAISIEIWVDAGGSQLGLRSQASNYRLRHTGAVVVADVVELIDGIQRRV